jgi:hypothetical protein
MDTKKYTYIKSVNGIAKTDLTRPGAIIALTDMEAEAYNSNSENDKLIKVKINLEKVK